MLRALAEIRPQETIIYIHELPGACVRGSDLDGALDVLPDAVEHHLAWLASHGSGYSPDAIEIALSEQRETETAQASVLFDADREPATSDHIRAASSAASLARRDVIDLYRSTSAFRRERVRDAHGASLADHLHDLARRDLMHAGVWFAGPPPVLPVDPVRALQASGAFSTEVFQSLDESNRTEVRLRGSEPWTVNKSIRLQVAHLRLMYPVIRGIVVG